MSHPPHPQVSLVGRKKRDKLKQSNWLSWPLPSVVTSRHLSASDWLEDQVLPSAESQFKGLHILF